MFFSVLAREGFTAAIEHCLLIELGIAPVIALLAWLLPRHPRDPEALPAQSPAAEATVGNEPDDGHRGEDAVSDIRA